MSITFHKQISSIMEVLTTAAVAEICKLVDDDYTVLHLEMSQFVKENEALKKKLKMMELRVSRRCPKNSEAQETSVSSNPFGSQVCGKSRGTIKESVEAAERDTGKQMAGDRCRSGDLTDSPVESIVSNITVSSISYADMEEGRTESLLIKEERLEEDTDPQGQLKIREERALDLKAGSGERAPIVDTQNKPPKHTEELNEQHRTRHSVWEVNELENVLKAEPENDSENLRVRYGRSEQGSGRLNSLDSECVTYERTSHLGTYFTQGSANAMTEDPSCSYTTETDSENLSFHSELQLTHTTEDAVPNSISMRSLDVKPELVSTDCVPLKVEVEKRAAWNKEIISGDDYTQHRHYSEDREREDGHTDSVLHFCPPHNQMLAGEHTAALKSNIPDMNGWSPFEKRCMTTKGFKTHRKVCTRKRKFICKYCGKGFPRAKELEIHQRVHTGEKPFSCTHCGKRFTQSCNLKTHLSIHTGEKPFRCLQCGKRFVQSGYLKAHQRVHTGEKPFSCTQCGKRFGQSSYLRSHQSVHTGEKPFSCAHCGKCFTRSCHLKRHQSVHGPGNCADVTFY